MKNKTIPVHAARPGTVLSDKERKTYIPFSPATSGNSGRRVLIDPKLLPIYLSAVDPASHHGLDVRRKIESIRSNASLNATDTSSSQSVNAFDRMLQYKGLVIYYKLQGGTVYITHIHYDMRDGGTKMGFYSVTNSRTKKSIPKLITDNKFPQYEKNIYINGNSTINHAQTEFFQLNPNAYSAAIFYYPPKMVTNHLGIWKSNGHSKMQVDQAAQQLAKIISTNAGKESTWTVEAEGATLLAKSLTLLPKKLSLSAFSIKFVNPVADFDMLIKTLQDDRKANVDKKSLTILSSEQRPSSARSSSVAIANSGTALASYTNVKEDDLNDFNKTMNNYGKKSFIEIIMLANTKLDHIRSTLFG